MSAFQAGLVYPAVGLALFALGLRAWSRCARARGVRAVLWLALGALVAAVALDAARALLELVEREAEPRARTAALALLAALALARVRAEWIALARGEERDAPPGAGS